MSLTRWILLLLSCMPALAGWAPINTVAVGSLGAAAQLPGPPPGRLLEVGGTSMHLFCLGEGSPTVVIDGGVGGWSTHYRPLQEAVAATTRACTYDRAGMGWSEPSDKPRTLDRTATELHALLREAGVEPPWVLVGHSLGGYIARVFVERFGDEVVGVVLAEAAHEEQWERLPPEAARATEAAIQASLGSGSPAGRALAAELRAGLDGGARVARVGDLGDRPLAVVSARDSFAAFADQGIPVAAANEAWMDMQRELAGLSSRSIHLVSETADHRIHQTDPELVLEAVRHVLRQVAEVPDLLWQLEARAVPRVHPAGGRVGDWAVVEIAHSLDIRRLPHGRRR